MLLNPGTILGDRYEIIEKIGSGGMAMVYRGKDKKLDRYVTVKVLREEFVGDEEFLDRFRSEACSAARLSHPNIVRVYDVGEDGDISYIVMEYIHGDTLKKAIRQKAPFDSRSTLNVAIQIASALSQAHRAHIVHRDIKPQNILVSTDGVIKVTDFGIARAATVSTMTTTANAAGSVHYFSPEQARGGYVDEKSDIYSLGITMYEMITGILPFQGNNSVSIALKHINENLPDIKQYNPNCTAAIEGIIKKATMKKADERYTAIDQMLADLIRARTDTAGGFLTTGEPVKKEVEAAVTAATMTGVSTSAGIRRSRRAEAAELQTDRIGESVRPRMEKPEEQPVRPRMGKSAEQPVRPGVTEKAEEQSVRPRVQRMEKAEEQPLRPRTAEKPETTELDAEVTRAADPKEVELIRLHKNPYTEDETLQPKAPIAASMVSFEKYGKKLRLSKEDEYENEYMEAETVKSSKRPERVRRNPRKEERYGSDRGTEKKVVLAAVITAVVIIIIISLAGMRMLSSGGFGGFAASDETVPVPLFVGVTLSDAQAGAAQLGIELVEEGQEFSSYFDEGYVIYQSVAEDTMVAPGSKIGIKTSLGLTSETMPNVVDATEKTAVDQIIALVGTEPRVEYEFDDEKEVGTVLAQTPVSGSSINAKTAITLTVSKGDESSSVPVPDVYNRTEEQARADLTAVGLVVGNVSRAESATIEEGKVMTQTLSAGQEVPSGSVVNLVISSGKPVQTEPEQPEQNDNNGSNGTQNVPDIGTTTPDESTTGTQTFTISIPSGLDGDLYVRVVKNDADGAFPVVDETRNSTQFPYTVSVTGRGSGTVSCYINEQLQWTQDVNFSG